MNRNFLYTLGVLLFSSAALASDSFYADDHLVAHKDIYQDDDAMSKQLLTGTGVFVTVNATLLLLSAGVLLWGLAGAIALYFLLTSPADSGYSGYSGGGSSYRGSGYQRADYSGDFRRSFNDGTNWEQFTILDFIAIAEEAYEKFNPADLECQKRLICEVHQNTSKFGYAAQRMVDWFSYLQYIEVLKLPEEIKALTEEYLDAADRGRNMTKECGEVYDSCEFSVKKITDKFSHNQI